MSDFTHKIVLFSEAGWSGDALVFVGRSDMFLGCQFHIEDSQYQYRESGKLNLKMFAFPGNNGALVVPQGQWELINSTDSPRFEAKGANYSSGVWIKAVRGWYNFLQPQKTPTLAFPSFFLVGRQDP